MEQGKGNRGYPLRSIGFYLDDPIFKEEGIQQQINRLRAPGTALIDRKSKKQRFKFPMQDDQSLSQLNLELAGNKVTLVGTFELGTDFAHDGNLIMNAESFAKYFPHRKRFGDPLSVVDLGVVHVQAGFDVEHVKSILEKTLEKDVDIFTREEFRNAEIRFWDKSTPIGTIFMAGKLIGFIVGMVICYQVIFSDIADHMPEFATLKAMGYPTSYFIRLIVVEALLLSLIGFIPGTIVSRILYGWLSGQTGLLMYMTLPGIAKVYAATVAMCVTSGMLAVRKLLAADPASLF